MRRQNYKFHAIAITAISAVIIGIYAMMGPQETAGDPTLAKGDRYIQIYSATWGANCNPSIDQAIQKRNTTAYKAPDPNAPQVQVLAHVENNNVLTTLSSRCDGRLTCTVPSASDALGVDPLPTCYKHLVVSYRCFSYDRLWNVDMQQGNLLTIDCNEAADATRK